MVGLQEFILAGGYTTISPYLLQSVANLRIGFRIKIRGGHEAHLSQPYIFTWESLSSFPATIEIKQKKIPATINCLPPEAKLDVLQTEPSVNAAHP